MCPESPVFPTSHGDGGQLRERRRSTWRRRRPRRRHHEARSRRDVPSLQSAGDAGSGPSPVPDVRHHAPGKRHGARSDRDPRLAMHPSQCALPVRVARQGPRRRPRACLGGHGVDRAPPCRGYGPARHGGFLPRGAPASRGDESRTAGPGSPRARVRPRSKDRVDPRNGARQRGAGPRAARPGERELEPASPRRGPVRRHDHGAGLGEPSPGSHLPRALRGRGARQRVAVGAALRGGAAGAGARPRDGRVAAAAAAAGPVRGRRPPRSPVGHDVGHRHPRVPLYDQRSVRAGRPRAGLRRRLSSVERDRARAGAHRSRAVPAHLHRGIPRRRLPLAVRADEIRQAARGSRPRAGRLQQTPITAARINVRGRSADGARSARRRGVPASHRGRAHEAQPRSPGRHRDRSRLARGGRGIKAVSDEPVIVFLGPSLPVAEARRVLPARYLSPVRCGDVLRVRRLKPRVIAIIDGLFETTAAVWHKEILLALEDGIAVFGAASMGALRAAELAPFGMVGVGAIFEAYRDGVYTDDDEVAVLHGPAAEGFRARSDAMVNVRATVARAVEAGVIGAESAREVIQCAKETFYQERSLTRAMDRAWGTSRTGEAVRFRRFIEQGGYVDQKRLDALALLRHLADVYGAPRTRESCVIEVNRSCFIMKLQHQVMCRPFTAAEPDLPGEEKVALEARLLGPTYRLLRRLALLMSMAEALARARGVDVAPRHMARSFDADDFGLGPAARAARWTRARDLDDAGLKRYVRRLATIRALLEASGKARGRHGRPTPVYEPHLLALMRIDGRYEHWRPATVPAGVSPGWAVLRNAERGGGEDFRLYRRSAKLWHVLDEAGRILGVEAPDDRQVVCDEFRRARGLHTERVTLDWMRRNDLDVDSYAELAAAEARLSILCEVSRTYTLGLIETIEPVCWLHDAIRLSGLYPRLKRRLAAPASSDGRARRAAAPDFEPALREHCARLGEPAPANVQEYARAPDL